MREPGVVQLLAPEPNDIVFHQTVEGVLANMVAHGKLDLAKYAMKDVFIRDESNNQWSAQWRCAAAFPGQHFAGYTPLSSN